MPAVEALLVVKEHTRRVSVALPSFILPDDPAPHLFVASRERHNALDLCASVLRDLSLENERGTSPSLRRRWFCLVRHADRCLWLRFLRASTRRACAARGESPLRGELRRPELALRRARHRPCRRGCRGNSSLALALLGGVSARRRAREPRGVSASGSAGPPVQTTKILGEAACWPRAQHRANALSWR